MEGNEKLTGRIFKLNTNGWGFISSQEMKFTRIFFHWSALEPKTLKFPELKVGMFVKFIPVEYKKNGWRALKIEVLDTSTDAVAVNG